MPLPWIQSSPAWLATQQAQGRPAVRFGDIPLDWTEFRLTFRQTVDVLHRFGALDAAETERLKALGREGHALEVIVRRLVYGDVRPTKPSRSEKRRRLA